MSQSTRRFPITTEVLDYLFAFNGNYKYVIDQFEFGKVRDPYDAVDLIDMLLKSIKELAENDYIGERIEEDEKVYIQLGKFADNIVWNYEVNGYYEPDVIVDYLEEVHSMIEQIYERELPVR